MSAKGLMSLKPTAYIGRQKVTPPLTNNCDGIIHEHGASVPKCLPTCVSFLQRRHLSDPTTTSVAPALASVASDCYWDGNRNSSKDTYSHSYFASGQQIAFGLRLLALREERSIGTQRLCIHKTKTKTNTQKGLETWTLTANQRIR